MKKELDQYLVQEEVEVDIQIGEVSKIVHPIFINNNKILETSLVLKLYNNLMHFMKSKIQFLISTIFKTTVQQNPNQLFKEEIVQLNLFPIEVVARW